MSPIDRRTFLARSAAATAALAGAGALVPVSDQAGATSPGGATSLALDTRATSSRAAITPTNLTVNGLIDPHGVDPDACYFAWTLRSSARGARQSGYRIVVHEVAETALPPIWDSGQITSARQAFIAYAGPPLDADASYGWSVEVRDQEGQWSAPAPEATFSTVLRPADWTAQWLHPSAASTQPDQVTYLRTVVTPPSGNLTRATAYISAAHTYQLYIGGQKVDFAPSFSYPDEQYVRTTDVTQVLKGAKSTVLGVLHRWYGAGQGRPLSAPGVIMELSLHYDNGQHIVYGTDASWKELPAEWLPSALRNTDGSDFVEWIDGRAHPIGWTDPAFNDAAWSATTVLGPVATPPFGGMVAQRTHISEQVVTPVSVRTLANGSVVADFGAIYAARPSVRLTNAQSGRTIAMHVGYALDPNGQVSTTHATQGTNLSYSYITRRGAQVFEPLTFLGFRYLQIDNPGETLGRDQVFAIASHAAMPTTAPATFATSVPMLDSVWKLNARSCLYCTHEQFVDTPTREKGPFVWDSSNESEAIVRAYGDQNMSWQGLRDVTRGQARYWPDGRVNAVYPNGDGARDIPIFTERYPEWVWRYYVATGDHPTAVALYPSTSKVANYIWAAHDPATGLLAGFAEGSNGDPVFGYDQNVTLDTASNTLGVNALHRIAQLAQVVGDSDGAATYEARAGQLRDAINAHLVRPDGIYTDGLLPDRSQSPHASQEANALALAYDVVPKARVAAVGAYVASLGIDVGPVHGLELLRGLANAGLNADLVKTLTNTAIPGWAHIVAVGGTFTWETWTPSDLIGDSMSHGWGSSALVAMQETLLGATLEAPDTDGAVVVMIAPPTKGLTSARGTVPTIAGPIALEWRRSGSGLSLNATIPPNASAHVSLPATSPSSVREGGASLARSPGVTQVTSGDGTVVVAVGSGTSKFTTTL